MLARTTATTCGWPAFDSRLPARCAGPPACFGRRAQAAHASCPRRGHLPGSQLNRSLPLGAPYRYQPNLLCPPGRPLERVGNAFVSSARSSRVQAPPARLLWCRSASAGPVCLAAWGLGAVPGGDSSAGLGLPSAVAPRGNPGPMSHRREMEARSCARPATLSRPASSTPWAAPCSSISRRTCSRGPSATSTPLTAQSRAGCWTRPGTPSTGEQFLKRAAALTARALPRRLGPAAPPNACCPQCAGALQRAASVAGSFPRTTHPAFWPAMREIASLVKTAVKPKQLKSGSAGCASARCRPAAWCPRTSTFLTATSPASWATSTWRSSR